MRILYFNYLWDVHGASIGSAVKPVELFAALEQFGHQVKICWMKDQPSPANIQDSAPSVRDQLKKYLAKYVHDPKLLAENIGFMKKEQRLVEEFKPDVIVARLDLYFFSALRTCRRNHLPLIVEADSPPLYEALEFQKQYFRIKAIPERIEKKMLQQADFVIMQSNILRDFFVGKYQIDLDKTIVAPNGVDPAKFENIKPASDFRKKYRLNRGAVVGFVGSMSVWHGIENLQKLIPALADQNRDVTFLLVGTGGGFEAQMQRFLEQNDLQDNVVFAGYVPHPEIPGFVQLMDVAVAPYPGLDFFYYSPVKIYEYMAAGKAVVTTDIGQISEVMSHEHDGLLAQPGNIDELINSVRRLLAEPELRKRLGANARNTIKNGHTWKHRAAQWHSVLEKIAAEHGMKKS